MAQETRPKGYPKLKNYKPSQFMLPTSHYDKAKADQCSGIIKLGRLKSGAGWISLDYVNKV